ncbi:hypothetical protein FVE85_0173 [Porphyridium purpureum]|uniref:Uncharacterized protein n=1 Tax=Porphyridium purpureum TaxID=35688 RepID=A0A5J4Z0D0_PORPP|nr:hypothetical protein FVE85_0173 [Porphyridium purpureum]|eukprot:POR1153..scf208_2
MHSDLMFIGKSSYLMTQLKPAQNIMISPIKQKTADTLRAALLSQKTEAKGHGITITEIRFDRESAVQALMNEMRDKGITPEITGAGEVVPAAERAIRLVKERVRSILYDIPYMSFISISPQAIPRGGRFVLFPYTLNLLFLF